MADSSCPYYRKISSVVSDIKGEFCIISTRRFLEAPYYNPCNHDNHFECPRYLRHNGLILTLEQEREEIVSSMPQSD